MKTKLIFIIITFIFFNITNAQSTFIPDHAFEQYLIDNDIDSDGTINGEVLTSDISSVTILDIKDYNIANFEGLQSFTSLTEFNLTNNLALSISEIWFGSNLQLVRVFILNAPGLSYVSVWKNLELTSLQVVTLGENLYTINVSNNAKLTHLSLAYNALEFLDVTNNVDLAFLSIDGNPIGNIDISNNTKLETLFCRECTSLTAVNLSNGSGSTILNSVLLTGTPELLCVKVDNIADSESASGWEKDATSNYVTDFGPPAEDPGFGSDSVDASVDGIFNLDDLFGVDSGNSSINKTLAAKKRRRWRRSRRTVSRDDDAVVDFPNKGSGLFSYYFEYIITNDCGAENLYEVEVIINDGGPKIENISIFLCENTEITTSILDSNLTTKNYLGEWFAKWNSEWIDYKDSNFGKSDFYKYASDHPADGGEPGLPDGEGSTVAITYVPCSVTYSFANAKNTNEGSKDFFEVDVMIKSSEDFKLGSGTLYFNYNTEAFGENISQNGKIEFAQPAGSILAEVYDYPAYKSFTQNDNELSRVSIGYQQGKSFSLMPANNITATPKSLFHLKIEYKDVSKSPNFTFEIGTGFLENTFTACGPYDSFNLPDCINFQGVRITDVSIDDSGAVLSTSDEILAKSIQIYPNPVHDDLNIDSKTNISKVEIYSVLGEKIKDVNSNFKSISLNDLSGGIYLVKIFSEKGFTVKKIVKQ